MIWFALAGVVAGATYSKGKNLVNNIDKGILTGNEDAPYYQERLAAYDRAIGSIGIGRTEDLSTDELVDQICNNIAKAAEKAFDSMAAEVKKEVRKND